MKRAGYSSSIDEFLDSATDVVLGALVQHSEFDVKLPQRNAWLEEINVLKTVLGPYRGRGAVYFEFVIPRLGKRVDVLAAIDGVVFVIEFKVGERDFTSHAIDQVYDYAIDLKNFHETSRQCVIAPVLVATNATDATYAISLTVHRDQVLRPISSTSDSLAGVIRNVLGAVGVQDFDIPTWENGQYRPTPTIIEAASALYSGHAVSEISRNDAAAINLTRTSKAISEIIAETKERSRKSICFVTGVPGAGKTLVGLNIATQHLQRDSELYSVFLSGNGPLVAILREALARDKVRRERELGRVSKKGAALSEVKSFVQNVHHFRDECLLDGERPPIEHVALFDEAQRAWNRPQTSKFMQQKKGYTNFEMSEPEFLISCLNRHQDWAVIVCLVGGGQEINTGEAGISEWIDSITRSFGHWRMYISPRMTDSEYGAGRLIEQLNSRTNVAYCEDLHLGVSMRSFRAEKVSLLVKQLLDLDANAARETFHSIGDRYPMLLTRKLRSAKDWLRNISRGSERFGIVASSMAQRLKPHSIDIRSPVDPIHWFLAGKEDVRSSYYLEDVATEFHVQGLEVDYACIAWDADFRHNGANWEHWSFIADRWNRVRKPERQLYLKNAYRVLLTRARQGIVIFVPEGTPDDPTRRTDFYDGTYDYLRSIGFGVI